MKTMRALVDGEYIDVVIELDPDDKDDCVLVEEQDTNDEDKNDDQN